MRRWGGGGTTTPTPGGNGAISPPVGASTWSFTYRVATAATCPVATPASGTATMVADTTGGTIALTDTGSSLSGAGPSTIVFTRDGTGTYRWATPAGEATLSFQFVTARRAEGEAKRFPTPDLPCSATWPFVLDRQ